MAASDPTTRREAARAAALARVCALDDDGRRDMTSAARRALREADERAVDDEARHLGQYPLAPDVRRFRVDLRAAARAHKASEAARLARKRRAALPTLDEARARRHA